LNELKNAVFNRFQKAREILTNSWSRFEKVGNTGVPINLFTI
jgi:hypothetical protein